MTSEVTVKDEMNMEELLGEAAPASQLGAIITARVVESTPQGLLVDVGLKGEGFIPISEFRSLKPPATGESFPAVIKSMKGPDGHPLVSWREAREKTSWSKILQARDAQSIVDGTVLRVVKGGLVVDIGVEAFLPASQADRRPLRDTASLVGSKIQALILEIDPKKGNVVLSRRKVLEREAAVKQEETLKAIEVGKVCQGTVTSLTNFGAFIDIGGVEGLVRLSDAAWGRIEKISDVFKVGQKVEVKVLRYDAATKKIALGRKQLLPHPWDGVEERFPVGGVFKGKVTSMTSFGAFVELSPGIEGLIHQSEFSWKERWAKAQDFLKAGQEVEVKIISCQRADEKIALSLKRAKENPWEEAAREYKPGSRVKGAVTHLVAFGAFVRLPSGIEGLLRTADLSWTKTFHHPKEFLSEGQEIEALVLEVNAAAEKISLGLKQLREDPFSRCKVGNAVTGKVLRFTESGAVIEIEPEVEGFVHVSEIPSETRLADPSQVLTVDQTVTAVVTKVNRISRRIELSIRRYDKKEEKRLLKQYQAKGGGMSLAQMTDWEQEKNSFSQG